MQQFILLRGHEGSGKSVFAGKQAAAFVRRYPDARVVCIDNDQDLYDEAGRYCFDFDRFAAAHRRNMLRQQQAFEYGRDHPQQAVLVINANPNQKAKTCLKHMAQAREHGFTVAVYRLHNFFANLHRVPEADVLHSYLRLNANPVAGEIHVAAVQPASARQRQLLQQMRQNGRNG